MEKAKFKDGRPSSFTQAKADKICNMLIGGKNIRAICKDDELPSCSTVYKWLAYNQEFSEQYARARAMQADTLFDEIIEIADETSLDTIIGEDGVERTNYEAIQHSRLRIDARKWMAGRLRPKKYGEKIQQVHTGADDSAGNPTAIQITIVDPEVENLTNSELIAIASGKNTCQAPKGNQF